MVRQTRTFWRRILGTAWAGRVERDLEDELRFHVEMEEDQLRKLGTSGPEARRTAMGTFGGVSQVKEQMRDRRRAMWIEDLWSDVRQAFSMWRRNPGFTAVALLTLSLGMGVNSATFSIVNGVILRPLGYHEPEQLVFLDTRWGAPGAPSNGVSPPEYAELRELAKSFSEVGAYTVGEVNLSAADRPQRVRSASVDDHLLSALGVRAAHGRLFAPGETNIGTAAPGQPPPLPPALAILSHELWQSSYGGAPIVGKAVDIDGRRHDVIGVMPPGVDVADNGTAVWLPLGLNPANRQARRASHYLDVIGRLKPGVTTAAAQTELRALTETWANRVGITPGPGIANHVFAPLRGIEGHALDIRPLHTTIVGGARRAIWILQAAVALVLLVACANLANLLLARAETRHRELAVRTALGAGRGRLLRQFMTEGGVYSVVGAALGLLLAHGSTVVLVRAYPSSLPRAGEIAIDWRVVLFTFGVAVTTTLLFTLAPLLHTGAERLAAGLKDGAVKGGTGARRQHVRRALVIAETALAVMLVIGAGLLVRSVYNLATVDAGFDRSRLVTFSVTLPEATYFRATVRAQTYKKILDRLQVIPGVQGATAMSGLPPMRPLDLEDTEIDNYTWEPGRHQENVDYYQRVMGDYFSIMGIPIVRGRGFQHADAASKGPVAVVNETFVDTFWKGQDPVGRRVRLCCGDQIPWFTVVGVAKNVKQGGVEKQAGTELYLFIDQVPQLAENTMHMAIRTSLPAATLARTIESIVRDVDPTVPVVRLRDMETVFDTSIDRPRLLAQLLGIFAALALLLAAIGTYGVLSYMVVERRREIGIRMALGAERRIVVAQVMKQGLVLAAAGVCMGIAGALGLNRLMASLLFGVRPTDAMTFIAVAAVVSAVAVLACALPAWRASRLDPALVLRND